LRGIAPNMRSRDTEDRSRRRAQWMAEVQRGDREAYTALLNDIGPAVMSFLRRRVHEGAEAQDLYQEVFVALHRARHTYQPSRPLEPWLFAIARHVVAHHRQRRSAQRSREVLVAAPPERAVENVGFVKPRLEQALRQLSAEQREAFVLLQVDGLSVEMAAARAGTTTGALKVRAHRAYRALRGLL
jgi:RNA polymerase sigma-70 factor (ECF subfamily)